MGAAPTSDLAPATGCGKVETGNLGEFDMGETLGRQLSTTDSRRAAAGWTGDAYSVIRCGAAVGFAQRWQSDAPAGTGRLADALRRCPEDGRGQVAARMLRAASPAPTGAVDYGSLRAGSIWS